MGQLVSSLAEHIPINAISTTAKSAVQDVAQYVCNACENGRNCCGCWARTASVKAHARLQYCLLQACARNTTKNKSAAMYIGDPSQAKQIKFGIKFVNQLKILGIRFSNEKAAAEI